MVGELQPKKNGVRWQGFGLASHNKSDGIWRQRFKVGELQPIAMVFDDGVFRLASRHLTTPVFDDQGIRLQDQLSFPRITDAQIQQNK